jgi:PilZ domain
MLTRHQDRRQSARHPLRQPGWLTVAGSDQRIPCVLWDVSDGGARLAAARHHELPDRFTLVLTMSGGERRCEIVWRNRRFVGVRFLH